MRMRVHKFTTHTFIPSMIFAPSLSLSPSMCSSNSSCVCVRVREWVCVCARVCASTHKSPSARYTRACSHSLRVHGDVWVLRVYAYMCVNAWLHLFPVIWWIHVSATLSAHARFRACSAPLAFSPARTLALSAHSLDKYNEHVDKTAAGKTTTVHIQNCARAHAHSQTHKHNTHTHTCDIDHTACPLHNYGALVHFFTPRTWLYYM